MYSHLGDRVCYSTFLSLVCVEILTSSYACTFLLRERDLLLLTCDVFTGLFTPSVCILFHKCCPPMKHLHWLGGGTCRWFWCFASGECSLILTDPWVRQLGSVVICISCWHLLAIWHRGLFGGHESSLQIKKIVLPPLLPCLPVVLPSLYISFAQTALCMYA